MDQIVKFIIFFNFIENQKAPFIITFFYYNII